MLDPLPVGRLFGVGAEDGGAAREGRHLHARPAAGRAGVGAVAAVPPRDAQVPGPSRGHRRAAGRLRRAGEADQLRGDLRRRHPRPQGDAGAARAARRPHDGAPARAAIQGGHGQHQGAPPRLRDLHAPAELQPADAGDAPDRAGRRGPARALARGAAARSGAPARRGRERPRAGDSSSTCSRRPSSPRRAGSTTLSTASTAASATTPSTAARTDRNPRGRSPCLRRAR